MNDPQYDNREMYLARAKLDEMRKAPLPDRREARAKFLDAMRARPEIVSERIAWILNGSYGYGEMLIARRILGNPRMNRAAALTQLVASLEWSCPEDFAREAWKQLTKPQQTKLDRCVKAAMKGSDHE